MRHIKHAILAMMFLSGYFSSLFAQSVWTKQVSGTTMTLNSVIWTGSHLVAVGNSGTILTSPDGMAWTGQTSGTNLILYAVAWTGSQLVAVGESGIILTSPDGVSWTTRTSGTTFRLLDITWMGNQLVAVGLVGTILTSPDGVSWTTRTSGITSTLHAVIWTGSQLAAAGEGGKILTSPDGVNWSERISGTTQAFWTIIWIGNQFFAASTYGLILASTDGLLWTRVGSINPAIANPLASIIWSGKQFVVTGGDGTKGTVLNSLDGVTWFAQNSGVTTTLITITWTGSQFVAVGGSGTILTSPQDSVPLSPAPIAPTHNATGVPIPPTLTWNASSGALFYRIQLSTDSTFKTVLLNDSSITTTSKAAGTLASLTVYYWRVNARNAAGTSAYSAIRHFTTGILPAVPVLNTPTQNSTGVPVSTSLTWAASSGAASYRVQLSTDSTFATTIINDSAVTSNSRAIGTLTINTVYYWRVNAKNTAGTSAYSTIWRFTTIPVLPPVLISPAQNAAVTNLPTLTWNASSGATSYRLQVSTNSGFTTTVFNDSTITGMTRAIGPLTSNTVYYWRANAKNVAGSSAYSAIWSFTTSINAPPVAPILVSPPQNAVLTIPLSMTWNASAGAEFYRVQESRDSTFATTLVNDSTVTGTSRSIVYSGNGTYYWRVNARNGLGASAYSAVWKFTVNIVGLSSQETIVRSLYLENGKSLRFTLMHKERVVIQVFNSQGRMISQLLDETRDAGYYNIPLSSEAQGAYFIDFRAGDFHRTMKIR